MPAPLDLALPLVTAAAAGLVGSIAVMRRMTLASDAISHVALPGIGLAVLLGFNPVLGGLAALFAGTLLVWGVEHKTASRPRRSSVSCSRRRSPPAACSPPARS